MRYSRGDIVIADLPSNDKHGMHGKRPYVIISENNIGNPYLQTIAIPISSNIKIDNKSIGKLIMDIGFGDETKTIVLNCDILQIIDTEITVSKIGSVNENVLIEISNTFSKLYGLNLTVYEGKKTVGNAISIENKDVFAEALQGISELKAMYKKDNSIKNKIIDYLVGGVIGAVLGYAITLI